MIEKCNSIVLRYFPTSNTSRIVTWLTEHQGKITTIIKGSQRAKSLFLGQYDLFYTCELLYYHREHRSIFHTRECSPLKSRPRLRSDWRAAAAASYFSDLLFRITPVQAPHKKLYKLLDETLDELQSGGVTESLFYWFELMILCLLGFEPQLGKCVKCGEGSEVEKGTIYIGIVKGGLMCERCQRTGQNGVYPFSRGALQVMKSLRQTERAHMVRRTRCMPEQSKELQHFMSGFLTYHLEINLRSRSIALDFLHK